MAHTGRQLARRISTRALEMGFALAGVCRAEPSEYADELRRWLDSGQHGSMGWLERNVEMRLDPQRMLPRARSILLVADQYAARGAGRDAHPPGQGRIARYARGDDYHVVMKKRLHALCDELREEHPDAEFRSFADTAPVLEREHAQRAGLGWIGKHTLLIHPRKGSYLLLGGVLTSLELEPPEEQEIVTDHCGACTRCIDACPTDAITPYSVDATRCISYLTIERREPIEPALEERIGDWIFGCDICQEVCPHNGATPASRAEPDAINPAYEPRRTGFDLLGVLNWSEQDRRDAFQRSALKRATLEMMKRNALIAAAEILRRDPHEALRSRIERIARDDAESDMLRAAARRTLRRLESSG